MSAYALGIITLFPEMFEALSYGITGRAQQTQQATLHYWNPRDFSSSSYRQIDDRPYGGGPGMVMMYQPIRDAIHAAKAMLGQDTPVIYLTPQGKPLQQADIQVLSKKKSCILLCGRYEGIDERIIERWVNLEYSIGDFVLSGGEIAAMAMIDALIRLQPHALHNQQSLVHESFNQPLLDHPHYTRPAVIDDLAVPEILLSGNHQAIEAWRLEQSIKKTKTMRPDLFERFKKKAV